MDRTYIDDHHIVARYLAEQLSDTDREAFEAYYLEHPDVVRELEAAARFKVGLRQLRDSGQLDAILKSSPRFTQTRYLAAAACVAMVAVGVFFWQARGPGAQPILVATTHSLSDRMGRPLPIASAYTLLRTRSASYDANIALPDSPQSIELRVLPEIEAHPGRYRIKLAVIADDDALHEIAALAGLAADADGFVPVYLNSSRLLRGRYQLSLSGDVGTTTAGDTSLFLIRITPPTATAARD
jgi:hypothetical protein